MSARATAARPEPALLVLADGTELEGEWCGARPEGGAATGEVVFNTTLTGYQEVLTDPSYAGQIVTFTYPHIGNYGVNGGDDESDRPACRGVLLRDLPRRHSSWRAEGDLEAFLERHGVPGMVGLDTRRLTRHLRDHGALPAAFGPAGDGASRDLVRAAAHEALPTDGLDLVATVTTGQAYTVGDPEAPYSVVAYDFGIKRSILEHLTGVGCRVEVVPAGTPADDVLAREPDGVFLSNGPGDPEPVAGAVEAVGGLLGRVPVFGICLGQQILGLALGGEATKLAFGHHGGNHPVEHVASGRVEITSQNHNYAIEADSVPGPVVVTHRNLNDGVCEGLARRDIPAFGVQFHPEAGPGPHDAAHLFGEFVEVMEDHR